MSIAAFGEMLRGMGGGCTVIGKALAHRLDVPFYEDRQERLLGHCLKENLNCFQRRSFEEAVLECGGLLPGRLYRFGDESEPVGEEECDRREAAGEPMPTQLTDEVWTRDHYPDSYNDCEGAVAKLPAGITGIYYHAGQMNLVLIGPNGDKVGIRSTSLNPRVRGGIAPGVKALGQLKKAVQA